MQISIVLLQQTLIMFAFTAFGYVLFKTKKITIQGSKEFANVLLFLIIPVVVINSFCTSFSKEKLRGLIISFVLAALVLLLSVIVSQLFFKKNAIDSFSSSYGNAGFIGLPLVVAAFGKEAVIYATGFVALLIVLQWTYGSFVLTKDKSKINAKAVFLNPVVISTVVGVLIFSLGIGDKMPTIVYGVLDSLSALNAPIAMIVLGTYLAQFPLKEVVSTISVYKVGVFRLVIIPLLTVALVAFLPIDNIIKSSMVILASAPVGANVAVFAQIYNLDYKYACKCVVLSTLLSSATLPLIYTLFSVIS